MKNFMDADFLLSTEAARKLYHEYAADMPIIDYHCHIDPREIYEDKCYPNITQLWLGVGGANFGDHYKWRLMRSCGVEEKYISGDAPDEERFQKWAECLEKAIGNPLYHWSHLELQRYFGITEPLTSKNAKEIYAKCNEKLRSGELSVRNIIRKSNVRVICTTDDPISDLEWHKKLAADPTFDTKVYPAFRPDKAMLLAAADYKEYIAKLSAVSGISIGSFADLKKAIHSRIEYFTGLGCRISDHGIDYIPYVPAADTEIEDIFSRRLSDQIPNNEDCAKFITAFMLYVGQEYADHSWVMQLHFGCKRNNNMRQYELMGPDTGYDSIGAAVPSDQLINYLNALDYVGKLPKTILYSLNPNDNAAIGSIIGCFQDADAAGKLQHGSAWWFNDHFDGMSKQLVSLANLGCLSTFVGMLTDSRSFLSYTRHEYFRRILCRILGEWIDSGMYPADWETLETIVKNISYNNAKNYFSF